jgi:hypothetical protein
MMIVYATEPGKIARDGTGRNSPFTSALLRHIDTEGASIGDVMIAVRNDVLSETGGKQRPFESASLTGQFFFKPKPKQIADKSSSNSDEIAVLREQIAKLQADQGALLKSQQEQLAALQKRLEAETKTAEPAVQQSAATDSGTTSRVVGVEPAKSAAAAPAETSASVPSPAPDASPPEEGAKVAATDSRDTKESAPQEEKTTEAPLPEGATREQLAQDILVELSKLGCYFGSINGNWTKRSQLALDRFNRHAKFDLPLDEPQQASLDALKEWKGPHCPLEKAVPPRIKQRPVVVVPKKQVPPRKAVKAAPRKAPTVQAIRPPRQQPRDDGGDAIRELQRAFPSTAWPQ